MLIDLSVTELQVIRKLLIHDQVADVVHVSTDHSMTQANKEILIEKLFVAIEQSVYEPLWIQ
jgi:hypothetical protein